MKAEGDGHDPANLCPQPGTREHGGLVKPVPASWYHVAWAVTQKRMAPPVSFMPLMAKSRKHCIYWSRK